MPGDPVEIAGEVGRDFGRDHARAVLVGGALATSYAYLTPYRAAQWLSDNGYRAKLADGKVDHQVTVEVGNCVYREVAPLAPGVVCALDHGMFCGLMGVSWASIRQTESILKGDEICRHAITV
jgi:hypothetical protein